MTTTPATIPTSARAPRGRVFRAHLVNEFRLLRREPAALIFGAILPLLAVIVMAAIPAARQPNPVMGGFSVVQTYVPVLVMFATSTLGLTVMPGILGGYRQLGVLRRLRTTPTSPASLLAALFTLIATIGVVEAGLIVVVPALFGVGFPAAPGWFALATVLATLAFVAMGTVLAALVPSAGAAAGIGNVVAVVMWAASGLWFPRSGFPDWLLSASNLTPGGAAADAMLTATLGAPQGWLPYVVLLSWTLACAVVAVRTFRWE